MAHVLVLDVKKGEVREADCENIQDFYRELDADVFDIVNRRIGQLRFDIYVDDEGLLKENPIISAVDSNDKPMLVGNLVFANHDSDGNTTSLNEMDIDHIDSYIHPMIGLRDGKLSKMLLLTECNY